MALRRRSFRLWFLLAKAVEEDRIGAVQRRFVVWADHMDRVTGARNSLCALWRIWTSGRRMLVINDEWFRSDYDECSDC